MGASRQETTGGTPNSTSREPNAVSLDSERSAGGDGAFRSGFAGRGGQLRANLMVLVDWVISKTQRAQRPNL